VKFELKVTMRIVADETMAVVGMSDGVDDLDLKAPTGPGWID
jgi:hypothetical protein